MPASQYFSADPAVPSRPSRVELRLPDATVDLTADRGVFSASRVDPGTVALLRAVPDPARSGDLLDLGCGYGPIACTLARRSPGATVWALDVNRRALALAAGNAARLGLGNLRAVEAPQIPESVRFTEVWSNPPVRIGKGALQDLLARWLPRLVEGGRALLVVPRNLGGDSLAAWLGGTGWQARRIGSKQGYRILSVTRAAGASPVPR